jgi:hypothetical protein
MSVNRYRPHVLVLPEDDANRQLANGFHLQVAEARPRQMQVLEVAGCWHEVLDRFKSVHVPAMERCSSRLMVLLIDFDGDEDRLSDVRAAIPAHLNARVFILGVLTEPEALKADRGPYETIGLAMANDCRAGTNEIWGHHLLQHNGDELIRLRQHVAPILFG